MTRSHGTAGPSVDGSLSQILTAARALSDINDIVPFIEQAAMEYARWPQIKGGALYLRRAGRKDETVDLVHPFGDLGRLDAEDLVSKALKKAETDTRPHITRTQLLLPFRSRGMLIGGGVFRLQGALPALDRRLIEVFSEQVAASLDSLIASSNEWTLLPTRRIVEAYIDRHIEASRAPLFVIFFDIDDFKRVNTSVGYLGGAEFLIQFALRLHDSGVFSKGLLGHISGDEFMAAIPVSTADISEIETFSSAIFDALRVPMDVGGHLIQARISIGASLFPVTAARSRDLMDQAQRAMQRAKSTGKNRCVVYSASV